MSVAAVDPPERRRLRCSGGHAQGATAGPRPCPWSSCRHHLASERLRGGRAPSADSCSLDLADRGGLTLDEVGLALGVTRERIRQIGIVALPRFAAGLHRRGLLSEVEALAALAAMRPGPGRPRGG